MSNVLTSWPWPTSVFDPDNPDYPRQKNSHFRDKYFVFWFGRIFVPMNEQDYILQTAELLRQDFELASTETGEVDEAHLIQLLADEVDHLMQYKMDWLMSLLYRLDVPEAKVNVALRPNAPEPANLGLARLLYERQRRRAHTKATIKTPKIDDENLAW